MCHCHVRTCREVKHPDCTAWALPLSFARRTVIIRGVFHVPIFRLAAAALFVVSLQASAAAGVCGSQADVPAEKRVVNNVHWTTASEEENFGYDVFRSSTGEKGPFAKLTKQPILGNGTTDETHEYKYADDAIDPCRDYWYYVESINTNGSRERFTPVFRAPAKRHPLDPKPEAH
jgi:hypothetical protein